MLNVGIFWDWGSKREQMLSGLISNRSPCVSSQPRYSYSQHSTPFLPPKHQIPSRYFTDKKTLIFKKTLPPTELRQDRVVTKDTQQPLENKHKLPVEATPTIEEDRTAT